MVGSLTLNRVGVADVIGLGLGRKAQGFVLIGHVPLVVGGPASEAFALVESGLLIPLAWPGLLTGS